MPDSESDDFEPKSIFFKTVFQWNKKIIIFNVDLQVCYPFHGAKVNLELKAQQKET